MRKKVVWSLDSSVVWLEREDRNRETLVEFTKVVSSKTVKTVKSTALVTNVDEVILLSLSLRKSQWMVQNRHKLLIFLPVCYIEDEAEKKRNGDCDDILVYGFTSCTTIPMETVVHFTEDLEENQTRKRIHHEATKVVLRPG